MTKERYTYPWPDDEGVEVSMEMIDPEYAEHAVNELFPINRRSSPARVFIYAETYRNKKWRPYRDAPIYFDTDGNCLNGEHRFRAIIQANVCVPMIVVTGCDPTDIRVIDDMKARTVADALRATGLAASATIQLGTAVRWLYLARNKRLHGIRNDKGSATLDKAEAFDAEPRIYDSFLWVTDLAANKDPKPKVRVHVPALTFLHYIVSSSKTGKKSRVEKFIRDVVLTEGDSLKKGTPERALREWLLLHCDQIAGRFHWRLGHASNILGPILNAWNAAAQNYPMQSCEVHANDDDFFIVGVTDPVASKNLPFNAEERRSKSTRFQGTATIYE